MTLLDHETFGPKIEDRCLIDALIYYEDVEKLPMNTCVGLEPRVRRVDVSCGGSNFFGQLLNDVTAESYLTFGEPINQDCCSQFVRSDFETIEA